MPQSSSTPSTSLITTQQLQLESERMQEVVLLVDNLLRQEEITLGLIVDCIYDIGSVRLIDKKLNSPFLRGATVRVARVSKPLFRLLALRWIKKNCPELLAKWLYSKVLFDEEPKPAPQPNPAAPDIQSALENPNPVEEISEQISNPPPLPHAVETAIDTGRVPPITTPVESPVLDGSPPDAIPTDGQVLEKALPNTSLPGEGQATVDQSTPTLAPPNSQVMSIEPSSPLPLPAITLEEYNRAIAQIKFRDTEITKLRTRSYILAGLLASVSVALGGALFWPLHSPEWGAPNAEPVQSRGTTSP